MADVEIRISDEAYKRLIAFKKVIDSILGKKLPNDDAYAELVMSIGLDRMLQDPLPKEEMLLKTMVAMFRENPEYVCDFIARSLEGGKRKRERRKLGKIGGPSLLIELEPNIFGCVLALGSTSPFRVAKVSASRHP